MPLYVEVATTLAERISEDRLLPGQQIDSEQRLSVEFQVSRGTVVKALDLLERQGIISRRQGLGTFVHGSPALRSVTELVSFTSHVEASGRKPGGRLLGWRRTGATSDNPLHRPFEANTPLVEFSRLRTIDDQPVGIHLVSVPESLAQQAGLLEKLDSTGSWSLYQLFESTGIHIGRGDEQFSAVLTSEFDAKLLAVDHPSALLRLERHTYDLVGRPIEVVEARYVADRYSVTAESTRIRPSKPRIARTVNKEK